MSFRRIKSTKLIKTMQDDLKETGSAVIVARNGSDLFEVKKCFRQGDALSCDLLGDDNSKGRRQASLYSS